MANRVFVNYYFRTKYGQGAKADAYIEEIKAEALKLGISEIRVGSVEIGHYSPSICFSLTFENGDAFGKQWGNGSEYEGKSAAWGALWKRINSEPDQVLERIGSDLIYEG
jgi:hypothetical protein